VPRRDSSRRWPRIDTSVDAARRGRAPHHRQGILKYLPNILSGARLILAPYIFWLMWRREYGSVLIWFLLSGITDGVDGWIARRWNAQSRLGAMLDPIGDKLLLSGSFLVLALDGAMEWWLAALVLGRDVVILLFAAGVLLFSKKKAEFPPSWWGKSSTVAQICYIVALVGHLGGFLPVILPEIGKWCVLAFLAISSVDYARQARRM
jgi:cardiolipin synthase (CMP-forming)